MNKQEKSNEKANQITRKKGKKGKQNNKLKTIKKINRKMKYASNLPMKIDVETKMQIMARPRLM